MVVVCVFNKHMYALNPINPSYIHSFVLLSYWDKGLIDQQIVDRIGEFVFYDNLDVTHLNKSKLEELFNLYVLYNGDISVKTNDPAIVSLRLNLLKDCARILTVI